MMAELQSVMGEFQSILVDFGKQLFKRIDKEQEAKNDK